MISQSAKGGALFLALVGSAVCVWSGDAATGQSSPPARSGLTMVRTEKAYPTGDRAGSVILLERTTPAEVRSGDEFTYEIKLTNLTRARVDELTLAEQFPATFNSGAMSPEPTRSEGSRAVWEFKSLDPGASQTLRVTGSTNQMDELVWCATVTFNTVACATTKIVQPELALIKTAPSEVVLCDEIPLKFVVTNAGTGVARNVRITDALPEGWTASDGRTSLTFDAGDLAGGQSREFSARAKSARTGDFRNTATAREDGGLTAESSTMTAVRKPDLDVSKHGPEVRYLGRPGVFEITVRNTGDAPAADAVLVDSLPNGTQFVSADNGGQFSGGRITWRLGTIGVGDSKTVSVTLTANQRGVLENTATATAYCADGAASARMEVKGIPAILLEVIDIHDPIEVGQDETYDIEVLNQGSAEGTNIVIACTLPPEMDFVSGSGPVGAPSASGKTFTFAPLPSLAPKAKAVYKVVVRGTAAGDLRFKVTLTSDQVDSPVQETESTHVY